VLKLGDMVIDTITGFRGIATGRAQFINGCVQFAVTAPIDKDGKPIEAPWIDEQRLKVLAPDSFVAQAATATAGGPRDSYPKGGGGR